MMEKNLRSHLKKTKKQLIFLHYKKLLKHTLREKDGKISAVKINILNVNKRNFYKKIHLHFNQKNYLTGNKQQMTP